MGKGYTVLMLPKSIGLCGMLKRRTLQEGNMENKKTDTKTQVRPKQ